MLYVWLSETLVVAQLVKEFPLLLQVSYFGTEKKFKSIVWANWIELPASQPRASTNSLGAWGDVVVKALRYYSDDLGIDSRWCHWWFFP